MATEIRLENAEEVKNEYISVLNDNLWDLKQLDERLTSFKRFLVETGSSDVRFDYESQMGIISQIEEDFETYKIASKQMIDEIDHIDSEFNKELSACVERLSLINIDKYEVKNETGIQTLSQRWKETGYREGENYYQAKVPKNLNFEDLMKTSLTRAMKKREYENFMKAIYGEVYELDPFYDKYLTLLYKTAEFDHTTELEGIANTVTNVLSVIAIGSGLLVISGGIFGFAVSGYVVTAGQVAGGILTAKDIGHLITGKDINGNPLSEADKQAITSSLIVEASMLAVNSFSKLKLKYANKINKVDEIEEIAESVSKLKNIGDDILDVMESSGGHTINRHVGKSKEYLIERSKNLRGKGATTYINKDIATKSVKDVLSKNSNDIVEWLNNSSDARLTIKTDHSFDIGNGVLKNTDTLVEGLRKTVTVIERTSDNEFGFRIITSYPAFD